MELSLAAMLSAGQSLLAASAIIGLCIVMCLRAIAAEFDRARRWHKLNGEAHHMRARQAQRLQELGIKTRRAA